MTSNHLSLFPSLCLHIPVLSRQYLFKPPANLSIYLTLFSFFPLFCFDCFLATVRIFVFCYCSLFVSFFFFLCFLLFFVFIVAIFCYFSFFVSEMKLFVRLTLCLFIQLYELIADKLQLVDEHITILCIFILA